MDEAPRGVSDADTDSSVLTNGRLDEVLFSLLTGSTTCSIIIGEFSQEEEIAIEYYHDYPELGSLGTLLAPSWTTQSPVLRSSIEAVVIYYATEYTEPEDRRESTVAAIDIQQA